MVVMEPIYQRAIKRANKLGAKGFEVVEIIEPQNATDDPEIRFVSRKPESGAATEKQWFDD